MQVGKGGLPPLKPHCPSTLLVLHLERGQATLPNLHLSTLELFQCGLRAAVLYLEHATDSLTVMYVKRVWWPKTTYSVPFAVADGTECRV